MKLLTKPKVYLVSKPSVDWDQVAAFLADEDVPGIPDSIRAGDDESSAIIEISARLCYMSFGRGRRDIADFINNLLSSKDGSVFEHVNYGFVFTGVSRSLTHELVRHRAGFAFSQRSQRYVDESEGAFVIPPALVNENGKADEANKILEEALQSASTTCWSKNWKTYYLETISSLGQTDARRFARPPARCSPTPPRPRFSRPLTFDLGVISSRCEALSTQIGKSDTWRLRFSICSKRKLPSCLETLKFLPCPTAHE